MMAKCVISIRIGHLQWRSMGTDLVLSAKRDLHQICIEKAAFHFLRLLSRFLLAIILVLPQPLSK